MGTQGGIFPLLVLAAMMDLLVSSLGSTRSIFQLLVSVVAPFASARHVCGVSLERDPAAQREEAPSVLGTHGRQKVRCRS